MLNVLFYIANCPINAEAVQLVRQYKPNIEYVKINNNVWLHILRLLEVDSLPCLYLDGRGIMGVNAIRQILDGDKPLQNFFQDKGVTPEFRMPPPNIDPHQMKKTENPEVEQQQHNVQHNVENKSKEDYCRDAEKKAAQLQRERYEMAGATPTPSNFLSPSATKIKSPF